MTDLQRALEAYDRRSQFHDRSLLDKIIQEVRNEETRKYNRLFLAALEIVEQSVDDKAENRLNALEEILQSRRNRK